MGALEVIGLAVLAAPVVLALTLCGLMWRAWWLYPAWKLFVVPLGVPPISFWHFTALLLCIQTVTAHVETKKDTRHTEWSVVVVMFFMPVLAWLLFQWIAR